MLPRCLFLLLLLVALVARSAAAAAPITVFAAASLTEAMTDAGRAWAAEGHPPPRFSFAASSTLAQGILHGAPVDLFVSADEKWMDTLAKAHAIAPATRADIAGNALVLARPKSAAPASPAALGPAFNWNALLGVDGRLAVGDPAHVPAGIYAEQALRKLGAWDRLQTRLARADSVRSALLLVERGEAPAGVVYATDLQVSPALAPAGTFPASSHDPIRYPAAMVARSQNGEALAFLAFLRGPGGRAILARRGFSAP